MRAALPDGFKLRRTHSGFHVRTDMHECTYLVVDENDQEAIDLCVSMIRVAQFEKLARIMGVANANP